MIDQARLDYLLAVTQLDGMTVNETMIAQAWIQKHAAEYDDIQPQMYLGGAISLGPGYSAAIQRQAALNSQKRADLVATSGQRATIVEIKLRVNFGAMGQLLGYRTIFHAEFPQYRRIDLVAAGYDALVDAVDVLHAHGVNVELFPNVTLLQATRD